MRYLSLFKLALFSTLSVTGCNGLQLYDDVQVKQTKSICESSKETLEKSLWDLWENFLDQNEALKQEIENNKYGIMSRDYASRECQGCLSVFRKNYSPQRLLLREDLFCTEDGFKTDYEDVIKKRKSMLLHDIDHDFWNNMLSRERRDQFSLEARIFHGKMLNAKTAEQKLEFLKYIGIKNPTEELYNSYYKLELRRKGWFGFGNAKPMCSDEEYFGEELHAFIAEYTYLGKIIIPKQLRKFYKGFISEEILDKDSLK